MRLHSRLIKRHSHLFFRTFILITVVAFCGSNVIPVLAFTTTNDLNAVITDTPYYDPGAAACAKPSSPTGSLVWPFSTKNDSQYQRVDQGWDLKTNPGGQVFAIAPGVIQVLKTDPGGFGNDYPTEQLDASISGPSSWVYYGHAHVVASVINQHVQAGQLIATTNTADSLADSGASQNGSAAPAGWLEIGFAEPNTDAPFDKGGFETPTAAGQTMKSLLINTQPVLSTSSGSASGCQCSVSLNSSTQLSPGDQAKIQQNQSTYEQAAQQTNVPWQLIAAIHYRETALSTTEPNLFQITGYSGPNDFLSQAVAAGNFIQNIVSGNLPNHRQPLQQTGTDAEEIKDTLYSYNGRAQVYAQQAARLGFDATTQPYEGSPYVMNNYDAVHAQMQIITHDNGGLDGVDTRLGAFTVYAALLGSSGGCSGNASVPSGNAQQLAQQIVSNANITYDSGSNGYIAQPFKDLAAGKLATSSTGCPATQVSTHILQEILVLAQNHKVNISSLTTDHTCGDAHTTGRALDINILDGKHLGSGNGPNQIGSYDVALADTLMSGALPALPPGSGFGDCDGHGIPTNGKQIVFFPDNCNHVHTQVPPGQ